LPSGETSTPVKFIVGSCMNYNKFMLGKKGRASGPETATSEDKRLGFPSFQTMLKLRPDFFIGTGDIVYYDHPLRVAKTVPQLRKCWHEQFRFPRMVNFFATTPSYWSKDDHDFRFNDSDNESVKLPLPGTGIELFREQMPILGMSETKKPTYRTHRVSADLQLWFSEGRDYRSPNRMQDGPDKTLWGAEQKAWLMSTLKASDAKDQALEKLLDEVDGSHAQALKQIAKLIDVEHNFPAAVGQVRALMFIEKFVQEVQHQLDASS
jgi:alkaline phosphatase/alkaline phosphatase D